MTEDHDHDAGGTPHQEPHHAPRNQLYRSRGINVEIHEDDEKVSLTLDGVPVEVAHVNGKYYSPTAHMYVEFDTLDQVVEQLISTSDEYWTLHPPEEDGGGGHDGHGSHSGHSDEDGADDTEAAE